MRIVALYHPTGEGALALERYASEYSQTYPAAKLELLSLDSRAGADMAGLYGLSEYPALLVIAQDGSLIRLWQGGNLPLMSELSAYAS